MKKFKLRKFYLGLINTFILLFLEVIFKMLTNNSIFNINIIYIVVVVVGAVETVENYVETLRP